MHSDRTAKPMARWDGNPQLGEQELGLVNQDLVGYRYDNNLRKCKYCQLIGNRYHIKLMRRTEGGGDMGKLCQHN